MVSGVSFKTMFSSFGFISRDIDTEDNIMAFHLAFLNFVIIACKCSSVNLLV